MHVPGGNFVGWTPTIYIISHLLTCTYPNYGNSPSDTTHMHLYLYHHTPTQTTTITTTTTCHASAPWEQYDHTQHMPEINDISITNNGGGGDKTGEGGGGGCNYIVHSKGSSSMYFKHVLWSGMWEIENHIIFLCYSVHICIVLFYTFSVKYYQTFYQWHVVDYLNLFWLVQ